MFYFSNFIYKKISFTEKSNPSEKKSVIVEEEIDCIDIDDIGNLEDSRRLAFIDEEHGNFMVVNDGGEVTRNINQKKKSDVLQ